MDLIWISLSENTKPIHRRHSKLFSPSTSIGNKIVLPILCILWNSNSKLFEPYENNHQKIVTFLLLLLFFEIFRFCRFYTKLYPGLLCSTFIHLRYYYIIGDRLDNKLCLHIPHSPCYTNRESVRIHSSCVFYFMFGFHWKA